MQLLELLKVHFAVGGPALLDQVNLSVEGGERIAVLGRNGAGKSTLLKLMQGDLKPDEGEVRRSGKVSTLQQEVPADRELSVREVLLEGVSELLEARAEFHALSMQGAASANAAEAGKRQLELQQLLDQQDAWHLETRASDALAQLGLAPEQSFAGLSGGMKRKLMLARALLANPDLLLLDEPTNHLDIAAIEAMENMLLGFRGAVVFITHDRRFLKRLATRIIEIDRGVVSSWPGDYDNYLRRKEERAHAEASENARFDKKLAQEEVWIRQGIKARRTRNEGRVRALKAMRRERAARRDAQGQVQLKAARAAAGGKQVAVFENLSFAIGGRLLIDNLSGVIQRGDRVGLIGANGVGKTTLIKLITGELKPSSGEIELGPQTQFAYFDQLRGALDESLSAVDNVAEGREFVEIGGQRKHVLGYLQDFLFTPERARAPITRLSGGERHRLLLAKVLLKPANLLILDEPTNDLDLETLELLEEMLADYPGTLILVSHDREFLDRIVSSSYVFEGEGRLREVAGGYEDWLRERQDEARLEQSALTASAEEKPEAVTPVSEPARKKRMGFKETRELAELPMRIEQLEARMQGLQAAMQEPQFYKRDAGSIKQHQDQLTELESQLTQAYDRWQALEAMAS
jgi:ATP-binding cassette subfamily F protein uup